MVLHWWCLESGDVTGPSDWEWLRAGQKQQKQPAREFQNVQQQQLKLFLTHSENVRKHPTSKCEIAAKKKEIWDPNSASQHWGIPKPEKLCGICWCMYLYMYLYLYQVCICTCICARYVWSSNVYLHLRRCSTWKTDQLGTCVQYIRPPEANTRRGKRWEIFDKYLSSVFVRPIKILDSIGVI